MNQLIYALTLVLALGANVAQAMEYDSRYIQEAFENNGAAKIDPKECIPSELVHLEIVKKLSTNSYVVVSVINGEVVSRGLLTTTKSSFSSEGGIEIMVRYRGVKLMKLENGFDAKFGAWEECK